VFVLGGSWSGVKGPKPAEVYNHKANTWKLLPNIKSELIHTKDPEGAFRADNYGWFIPVRRLQYAP
jgi:galactose oxidase